MRGERLGEAAQLIGLPEITSHPRLGLGLGLGEGEGEGEGEGKGEGLA